MPLSEMGKMRKDQCVLKVGDKRGGSGDRIAYVECEVS